MRKTEEVQAPWSDPVHENSLRWMVTCEVLEEMQGRRPPCVLYNRATRRPAPVSRWQEWLRDNQESGWSQRRVRLYLNTLIELQRRAGFQVLV